MPLSAALFQHTYCTHTQITWVREHVVFLHGSRHLIQIGIPEVTLRGLGAKKGAKFKIRGEMPPKPASQCVDIAAFDRDNFVDRGHS